MSDNFESAARSYCAARGLDPDELVNCSHPKGYAVLIRRPRWSVVAVELADLNLRMECIRVAATP